MQTFLKSLEPSLAETLERYALKMGTTVERCVEEAIVDWIFCCAQPRLDKFDARSKMNLVKR